MGNRATVVFTDGKGNFSPAVYLHWNGGPESIYGFLEELARRDVRADQEYECARFIQLVGEFFDQDEQCGLSLGVVNGPRSDAVSDLNHIQTDHGNNGLYLVDRTGPHLKVRRFTEERRGKDEWGFKEWAPERVEQERAEAEGHTYRAEFREFYAALADKSKLKAAA
ncbi:MAG: hypothetical protein M3416_01400 [Acidobacteriota bacterium]|nr:hypothetical protein [Acidobacteriota bacterium]